MNTPNTRQNAEAMDSCVRVCGLVQGVGFRPFVQRTAARLGVGGWVRNDCQGVLIRAVGGRDAIEQFVHALKHEAPPAARVDSVTTEEAVVDLVPLEERFQIIASEAGTRSVQTAVPVDLALCVDCRSELLDPADRRFLYPFLNCTQCGPRYSMIEHLPYDRACTTMQPFRMCTACNQEYLDPASRRIHAQPNACPVCGPRLAVYDGSGSLLAEAESASERASVQILSGGIVAVKGVGGFHLMCDATNEGAVAELRRRKHREEKPFAVMFPTVGALLEVAEVSSEAQALLESPAAPVVLVPKRGETGLAASVAPGNPWLGALLPYSALHVLLMNRCARPLVATSANLSEEPLCIEDVEARSRLAGMADLFLGHDRRIARPVDDSVVRFSVEGAPILLRRARGYAPSSLRLPQSLPVSLLCVGGQMKTTVAVAQGSQVVLSPHIGDLENVVTLQAFERTIETLAELHGAKASVVAHDKHPGYRSTHYAQRTGLRCVAVQHHLAHVLACLLENGQPSEGVLGVSWDGTGYGEDGTVWGGEFILLESGVAKRFARLRPFRLPGGEAAVRDARRVALALANETGDESLVLELAEGFGFKNGETEVLRSMLAQQINSPLCSSAGRLFDAAAVLLGLGHGNRFEGQLPLALEAAAMAGLGSAGEMAFPLRAVRGGGAVQEIDWQPALEALRCGEDAAVKAAAFHRGLARAIANVAVAAGVGTVALTGGCFQNALLHDLTRAALEEAGFSVLVHRQLPPNDGNLAAGQALGVLLNLTDVQLPPP